MPGTEAMKRTNCSSLTLRFDLAAYTASRRRLTRLSRTACRSFGLSSADLVDLAAEMPAQVLLLLLQGVAELLRRDLAAGNLGNGIGSRRRC